MSTNSPKQFAKRRAELALQAESKRVRPDPKARPYVAHFTSKTLFSVNETTLPVNNSTRLSSGTTSESITPIADIPEEPMPETPKLTRQLQDFQDNRDIILEYLFDREHHLEIGLPCCCGRGKRLVCCSECLGHAATCAECFISNHLATPCHWANVWQEAGFFVRRDISKVIDNRPFAIPLGHNGQRCPNSSTEDSQVFFHIIDHNGVHDTLVHFCTCRGTPNRVQQLIQYGLFPATFNRPVMAFTLTVIKEFHIHHLESKESAYDYIGSLRRLTDNMFASETCDPYSQFLIVMRFWRVLIATKRLGQAHGIDQLLPHRPPGNLLVFCPACPKLGLNMEKKWCETLDHLSHLNQIQITLDGNFHSNRYKKNSSPNDYSLFQGRAYYPLDSDFKAYLRSLPAKDIDDKIGCPLKAVQNRNLVVDNLSETGTINVQCPHVIVRSTVDLQQGEQYANSDYALAIALRQIQDLHNNDDQFLARLAKLLSYDMCCSYLVNLIKRFETYFPDLVETVKRFKFLIPLVHVRNHQENCEYRYSSMYVAGAGHFHGETAEHEWAELNQLAPQVHQMNNGHRQDTLIDHHGDWNFKKMANMGPALEVDIIHSRKVFTQKREDFITMTKGFSDRAPLWDQMDRNLRTVGANKQVQYVFHHKTGKVPSQAKIYQALLDRIKSQNSPDKYLDAPNTVRFLNEGITLERKQHELASKLLSENSKIMTPKEIASRRKKLANLIKSWKVIQKAVMADAMNSLSLAGIQASSIDEPEQERLHLPSNFSIQDRSTYGLDLLAADELLLRKGSMFDYILTVQQTAKSLSVLRTNRHQNDRGQVARTRSGAKVQDSQRLLNLHIKIYNACRNSMVALGGEEYSQMFPTMTLADTYRMPTHSRREIGTSCKAIYHNGVTGGTRVKALSSLRYSETNDASDNTNIILTQGHRGKSRSDKKSGKDKKGTNRRLGITEVEGSNDKDEPKVKADGWIWCLGGMDNLSSEELQQWSDESDRVQWFRAEAEMQRWQEEHEINQAQFLRCIRAFQAMSSHWNQLAEVNKESPGHVAYAKKTSVRFHRLELDAKKRLGSAGYQHLVDDFIDKVKLTGQDSPPLSDLIQKNRDELYVPLAEILTQSSLTDQPS